MFEENIVVDVWTNSDSRWVFVKVNKIPLVFPSHCWAVRSEPDGCEFQDWMILDAWRSEQRERNTLCIQSIRKSLHLAAEDSFRCTFQSTYEVRVIRDESAVLRACRMSAQTSKFGQRLV